MKLRKGEFIQQGDVIIRKISKLPEGLELLPTKVLQESETTGHHHHFLPDSQVRVLQMGNLPSLGKGSTFTTITPNFGKYIEVTGEDTFLYHGKGFDQQPAKIGRGDHDALHIPPGIYEIDIVREYDYDRMEAVRVVD